MIFHSLLPKEEPEVSRILKEVFQDEGIKVAKGKVSKVEKNTGGSHTATTTGGESIKGDVLLVSVGRTPNVKGFGLEAVGIGINDLGGIDVNNKLQTAVKGIYAAGDCTGSRQL